MKNNHAKAYIIVTLAVLAVVILACWWQLKGGPPRKIVFAAGSKDGAYYAFAQEYAKRLADSGLEVEFLETKGSVENLAMLEDGRADIAYAQSGLKGKNTGTLRSLGSMFYEPLWVFSRGTEPRTEFTSLKGKRLGIGEIGSGTREVAVALLTDNKLIGKVKLVSVGGEAAKRQLVEGQLDALFIVGAASIPTVKELANRKDVTLINVVRAKAYSRYHDSLSDVMLFRGMLNLADDIPVKDQQLVATAANLVVSDKFHYALVTLILQTAKTIHGASGPFQSFGEFPSPRLVTFPLVPEADAFYTRGPSFFFRNLPFYLAATLDRLIIVLLPLITLLLPLSKILPPTLAWWLNRDLSRLQTNLAELEINKGHLDRAQALEQLEALRKELWELKKLPADKQNDVFLLEMRADKLHADLARDGQVDAQPSTAGVGL